MRGWMRLVKKYVARRPKAKAVSTRDGMVSATFLETLYFMVVSLNPNYP